MQQLVEMSASVKLSAQMHVSLNEAKAGKSNNSTEQPDNSFFSGERARWNSNPRHSALYVGALSTELYTRHGKPQTTVL